MNCLNSRIVLRAVTVAVMAAAIAACQGLKPTPEPDTHIGPGGVPERLTDHELEAVTPVSPGDKSGGGAPLPGAVMVPATEAATQRATQPAAQATTQPATQTATGPATVTTTQPTLANGQPATREPGLPVPESLSVQDAILVALSNNSSLRVDKYNVPIQRTNEEFERADFDPTVNFSLQGGRVQNRGIVSRVGTIDSIVGNASVTEFLPTGTRIQAGVTTSNYFYSESSESLGPNLSVTQALLRGRSVQANLASLRRAELGTKISQYVLRNSAEATVANAELDYWSLAYAERAVVIYQNALAVAEQTLADTNARIDVGALAASERAAAVSTVTSSRVDLINARSTLEIARITFLRDLTSSPSQFVDKKVNLTTLPFIPLGTIDPVEAHIEVALRMRPEVNEAKLALKQDDLEVVRTKDGLLPRLDLFVQLGKNTLGSNFGESFTDINGLGYSAVVGVQGDWEPINRAASANYRAAQLTREQKEQSVANLNMTVQLQVRVAYALVTNTHDQIDAKRADREAKQQTFDVEQAKLLAGSGKSLDVAKAQSDLVSAQAAEVKAVTNHLQALVSLYAFEGSLLLRRGIEAPGVVPVGEKPAR